MNLLETITTGKAQQPPRIMIYGSEGEVVADCYLIAVEKREPMRCGVWKLTDGILETCALENKRAIAELRKCRRENVWPTRTEDMRILDV